MWACGILSIQLCLVFLKYIHFCFQLKCIHRSFSTVKANLIYVYRWKTPYINKGIVFWIWVIKQGCLPDLLFLPCMRHHYNTHFSCCMFAAIDISLCLGHPRQRFLKTWAYFSALPALPQSDEEVERPQILMQWANYIKEKMWASHLQSACECLFQDIATSCLDNCMQWKMCLMQYLLPSIL